MKPNYPYTTSKCYKIIELAKKKSKKNKVSFTIDSELYEDFKRSCKLEKVAASRIVEILIKEFTEEQLKREL